MEQATDWDAYYRRTPSYTQFTRRISQNKLLATLRPAIAGKDALSVCELGGANSCFLDALVASFAIAHYHILDLNAYGLELVRTRAVGCLLTTQLADVRTAPTSDALFDVVYSIGLIEHFDPAGTAAVIAAHFARCKPGGVVLMTFPTPTLPYRLIRSIAQRLGKWSFHDERPLSFAEVERSCLPHGEILHRSINWWIGLTQGYVLIKKNAADGAA